MTDQDDYTSDEFETVYEVYNAAKGGFGGGASVTVAVTRETDDVIVGRKLNSVTGRIYGKWTIQKDNVAAWEERENLLLVIDS